MKETDSSFDDGSNPNHQRHWLPKLTKKHQPFGIDFLRKLVVAVLLEQGLSLSGGETRRSGEVLQNVLSSGLGLIVGGQVPIEILFERVAATLVTEVVDAEAVTGNSGSAGDVEGTAELVDANGGLVGAAAGVHVS